MIKKILLALVMMVGVLGVTTPVMAWDDASNQVCSDTTASAEVKSAAGCGDKGASVDSTMKTVGTILNFVIGFVAVIAVIIIVVAGINMTVSQGEPGKVAKARNMIIYAAIGLVVAILAFAIVNFALTGVFGVISNGFPVGGSP